MDSDLVVSASVTIPATELHWQFSRSSGPGGQGVNTTDSRVELRWDPHTSTALPEFLRQRLLDRIGPRLVAGAVVVVASQFRSQLRNRDAARERLATLVRQATQPPAPPRRPTRPSAGARRRRMDDKRRRSEIKKLRRADPT